MLKVCGKACSAKLLLSSSQQIGVCALTHRSHFVLAIIQLETRMAHMLQKNDVWQQTAPQALLVKVVCCDWLAVLKTTVSYSDPAVVARDWSG